MRALIVRLSSLGDVVHAAPVLTDIHRAHPGTQIDWVVEEAFVPLVGCFEGVRRVVPFALRRWRKSPLASRSELSVFWRDLRRERYDAVLDLQGLIKSAAVARAARLAQGGLRWGLGNRTDGAAYEPLGRWFYDRPVEVPTRVHVVDRSRMLVAQALGHAADDAPRVPWRMPAVDVRDAEWADPRAVLLIHGSAKVQKLLNEPFWIALGRQLAALGLRPLLPWGTPDERQRADLLALEIGASAAVLPRLPLDRLTAVMARMRGSIGLDTGLSHMSATLGRPTVQLFIEDKAWRAGAYWEPRTAVLQASELRPPTLVDVLAAWEGVAG